MTWEQVIGLSLALVVMLVGLIGSIIPGLPGSPLVLAVAIGHRLYFGAASISNTIIMVLVVLTVISIVFDLMATALGAKKFGATWRGAVGAVVGLLLGVIGKFSICVIMIALFATTVLLR